MPLLIAAFGRPELTLCAWPHVKNWLLLPVNSSSSSPPPPWLLLPVNSSSSSPPPPHFSEYCSRAQARMKRVWIRKPFFHAAFSQHTWGPMRQWLCPRKYPCAFRRVSKGPSAIILLDPFWHCSWMALAWHAYCLLGSRWRPRFKLAYVQIAENCYPALRDNTSGSVNYGIVPDWR